MSELNTIEEIELLEKWVKQYKEGLMMIRKTLEELNEVRKNGKK